MKGFVAAVVIVLAFCLVCAADSGAQMGGMMGAGMQQDGMGSCGMMGGGMMGGGMMGRGMGMMRGDMDRMGRGMRGMMMDGDHPLWRHLGELGLDQKQKEAIREIKGMVIRETIRKRAEKQIAMIELDDILDADPVDMKAAETKLRQIEGLRTEIHLSRIKALEEIKAKLTPEQRKKLVEILGEDDMRMGGMGPGMMMGPGHADTPKTQEKAPPAGHSH